MTLNEISLETKFNQVSTSQGSIQSLSFFCLHYKNHHKKIAQIWLRCLQKAEVPHRLTLIYLANDIVQNARRKNTLSFINDFKNILKDAVPYLRDEKIKKSVERVFSIWQDRNIFDNKFTNELKNSLNGAERNVQPQSLSAASNQTVVRSTTDDLMSSLDRLAIIEKNLEGLRSSGEDIVDRLAQGEILMKDDDFHGPLDDLTSYMTQLKTEIDERYKLGRLLDDSLISQKKLLKESEEQLTVYRSQLEYIKKLRDDLQSPS